MPEKCSECGKTVYVVEKLTILNRTFHKWCFKCVVCKQTLTMKNYSAVGGKPYCKTHYPAPGKDKEGPAPEAGSSYGDASRGSTQVITTPENTATHAGDVGSGYGQSASSDQSSGGGYDQGGYEQQGGGGGYDQGGYDQGADY
jgi:hypothetical protein